MSRIYEALRQAAKSANGLELEEFLHRGSSSARCPDAPALTNLRRNRRKVTLNLPADSPLLPFSGPDVRAGEQYRVLRTRILHSPMRPQIILVTSSGTGDGKTTTSINLAGALALKEDTQVLLLDGDLRRSTIHSKLGIENGPGLREYLGADISLEEAVVDCGEMANLRIMTAGASAANACELLDSPAWVSLCATLRTMYRYIIIDSPPVASVADYDLLQDVADGIVVVMRPDHTKRKSASEALRHIPRSKLLGVVLNCMSGWLLEGSGEEYYYYYAQPQHATSKKH